MKNAHKKPNKHKALNQVRIVGGQFKRRYIHFIDADGLRPTTDRMRETLFNWLMHDIFDANILDTCAGSGVLGFEALSRGASKATFIEANQKQANQLQQTAINLGLSSEQFVIHSGKAETIIDTIKNQTFNIVFIDPPYALNLWQPIIDALLVNQLINDDSLLYIESNKTLETIFDAHFIKNIQVVKQKTMGQIFSWVIQLKHTSK
ncbi:MAG: 16S rRNA (guanine(966)-N(2))-methyltransferase RsmD [Gammaproteobacteria bacterium]|nr:MAG: 16S rRNA (guanine(966)-N(2))-methyltransferase RsmD [Gammaproteobacteria bacterium]